MPVKDKLKWIKNVITLQNKTVSHTCLSNPYQNIRCHKWPVKWSRNNWEWPAALSKENMRGLNTQQSILQITYLIAWWFFFCSTNRTFAAVGRQLGEYPYYIPALFTWCRAIRGILKEDMSELVLNIMRWRWIFKRNVSQNYRLGSVFCQL